MHIDLLIRRGFDGIEATDVDRIDENRINTKPVSLMAGDRIGDFVGRVTIHTGGLGPGALRRRIIREFGLVEINPPPVAIPHRLILLMMLHEKAVNGDVVAIHHQTALARIPGPVGG